MALLRRRERTRYPAVRGEEPSMLSLRDQMFRLFDDFLYGLETPRQPALWSAETGEFIPNVDVTETDGELKISAELPGMTEKDVSVELDEETATISGEKKREEEEEKGGRYWRETSYGSFRRDIPLPVKVETDKASATFQNGTLRITVPKSGEAKAKRRSIEIT